MGRPLLSILIAALLLAACGGPLPRPDSEAVATTSLPDRWSLEGRLGVRADGQAWHVALDWRQTGEDFVIDLSAPFGRGLGRLEKAGPRFILVEPDGQRRSGDKGELEQLLKKVLGVSVPLEGLRFWVMGRPWPERSWEPLSENSTGEEGIVQEGWRIDFEKWTLFDGRPLPSRLTLRRNGVRVRLALHHWQDESAPE